MQTENTVKYQYTPKITVLTIPSVGEDVEQLEASSTRLGMLNSSTTLGLVEGICLIFKEMAKLFSTFHMAQTFHLHVSTPQK